MRHLLLLCSVVFGLLSVSAQEQIETESIASDDVVDVNKPLKVVREINGGTVFKISYGDGFNIQMKGAFEHACKILEEYLPPCLPITVRVEWGSIGSSTSGQVLSKVSTNAKDNFGTYGELSNVMPKIKAVTLGEYVINSNVTFFNSIPNVSFFDNPDKPDIRIVYNESLQREFSYSLEADYEPYDTYDFVSVVIRDLLKGLGFFNRLRKDPLQNKIINPVWRPNDFEFGFVGSMPQCSSDDFFSDVTSGSVELYVGSSLPGIKLYAPETWADGMSLNYFIPDDTYALSNSLSYQFGRGSIVRDINDKYANDIFRRLLGWKNDLAVGSVGGASSSGGSTQNFIPFNGEFKIKKHDADDVNNVVNFATRSDFSSDKLPLVEYLDQFHPGQGMAGEEACSNSLTMAILKKDGTWDIVYRVFSPQYLLEDAKINMGDFEFHYDQSEYARTCDGYLRGRLAYGTYVSRPVVRPYIRYKSKFYVIDYLPQKTELEWAANSICNVNPGVPGHSSNTKMGKLVFKNLEGITKLVLEKRVPGNNLPIRTEIPDFQNGSYYVEFDGNSSTTFNLVGYNANGYAKSEPLEYYPFTVNPNPFPIVFGENEIRIPSESFGAVEGADYQIIPMNAYSSVPVKSGRVDAQTIDISELDKDTYSIRFVKAGETVTEVKFKK